MASFLYRVRDSRGRALSGTVEAETSAAAADQLRQQNLIVIELRKGRASTSSQGKGQVVRLRRSGKKVSIRDLAVMCRQFATMSNAGLPVMSILNILEQQAENKTLGGTMGAVSRHLRDGSSLSDAFGRYPQIFPNIFTSMVEAGEIGGVLDEVMERLATHFEREHALNEKVRSALTYPAVIAVVASVAVTVMIVFVVPKFVDMLTSMGVPLPLPTQILMTVSGFMGHYWYLMPLAPFVVSFALRRFVATPGGRFQRDRLLLKLPIFGELNRKMIVSRFARTLSTLLRGGVAILQALDVVKKTTGNVVITRGIESAQEAIRFGGSMAPPLAATKVFPPLVTEMIAIGEETGAVDSLLERLSNFYDQEVDSMVGRLTSMIEPVVLVGMGVVMAFIVLSIMLPMFQIITAAPQ